MTLEPSLGCRGPTASGSHPQLENLPSSSTLGFFETHFVGHRNPLDNFIRKWLVTDKIRATRRLMREICNAAERDVSISENESTWPR